MSVHLAGITTPIYARPAPTMQRAAHPGPRSPGQVIASSTTSDSAFRSGVAQERSRWAKVFSSKAFGAQPVAAAHLLAGTDMSAGDIIGSLRQIAADVKAGPAAREASIADRWAAAFERARAADDADGPRPSRAVAQRWGAALKRAGVA